MTFVVILPSAHSKKMSTTNVAKGILDIIDAKANFFLDQYGLTIVHIQDGSKDEWLRLDDQRFRDWCRTEYKEKLDQLASTSALNTAIEQVASETRQNGQAVDVFTETMISDQAVYLDTRGNGSGTQYLLRVDARGVKRVLQSASNPKFLTVPNVKPVVYTKQPSGSTLVKAIENACAGLSTDDRVKVAVFLVAKYLAIKSRPHLVITGPQGSGKSTLARSILTMAGNENVAGTQLVTDPKDVVVQAKGGMILYYDNVQRLSEDQSNTFCKLSTGAGITFRKLYSNDDEYTWTGTRSAIPTAITDPINADDLRSRCLFISLSELGQSFVTEAAMEERLEEHHADVFSLVLDAVSASMKRLPSASSPSRMGDLLEKCRLAKDVIGVTDDELDRVFQQPQATTASSDTSAGSSLIWAVTDLLFRSERARWEGTASDLADALNQIVGVNPGPYNSRSISTKLSEVTSPYSHCPIVVSRDRSNSKRSIIIEFEANSSTMGDLLIPELELQGVQAEPVQSEPERIPPLQPFP